MTQTPITEVESTYGLYTIEDLSPAASIKNEDLLIINTLRTDTSTYVTSKIEIRELVDYVIATVELGGTSPVNVFTKGDIMSALNNSDSYNAFKEYLMNL